MVVHRHDTAMTCITIHYHVSPNAAPQLPGWAADARQDGGRCRRSGGSAGAHPPSARNGLDALDEFSSVW